MTNNEIGGIENSFDTSFLRKNFEDVSMDLAESIIDSAIENEIVREIPIFKTIYAVGKTILGIRHLAFTRKVLKFLLYTDNIPIEQRKEFLKSLNGATENRAHEVILHILDKFETDKKVKSFSKLLKAKVESKISIEDFLRLSKVIEDTFYNDLEKLVLYKEGNTDENMTSLSLLNIGLVHEPNTGIVYLYQEEETPILRLYPTLLGKLFLDCKLV